MHPIISCQAARATGLLPYAIINSLAVSTDHWFPLKTAVAQYPRQVLKPPKKPQPATAKNCPPNESEKPPNWVVKPQNWQHWRLIMRGVKTLRTQDTSDPRHFSTSGFVAEVSVRHFSTSPELTPWHQGRQFGTGQHWTKPWQGGRLCLHNYMNYACFPPSRNVP